ncbi:hypothetical protein C0Q70_13373 [Pomacea canaliculata]|uniref:TOG domain-containing protein n=1 Tax=Pomacea canaliculata TaxID=400727 RepID=A0A2T7NX16_POMCA|nr:hypothetical protein C0Q70_13373 [Pomacea canaliculata]
MASKVQVAKFPLHDFIEGPVLDPTSSGVWNMEENDVLGQLNDESFKKRVEILEQLIITVRRNGGRLPYSDHESIFRGLGLALSDSNWEIRLKCIHLLQELIPSLQEDLDRCMSLILNKLIPNIGDSKVTVRKAVVSNLHQYMKHTNNRPTLLHAIVSFGLENEDARVRRETINALPLLLTRDFAKENFYGIIQSLAKKLLDASIEDNLKDVSLSTLQSIEKLVGEEHFDAYIQKLSPSLRKYYQQLTGKVENGFSNEPQGQHPLPFNARQGGGQTVPSDRRDIHMDGPEFGIIPSHVMIRINDQMDFKTRAQAVEDLKGVINVLTAPEIIHKLIPHMTSFMNFLSSLLDDSNFKIITVTLEILYLVVERLGPNVKTYVRDIVNVLSKRMGDNKVVIRQSVMRVVIKMMQSFQPQAVLSVIFENLSHRNSRVRQETINFIIASLLTFPSYEFDLPNICAVVGPTLTDVKRQVRQAALECFAVLAQAMGSGRLQPLVQAVDQVELSSEGEGLMAAVQARLARRQLPRLNSEGLVEYATPIPSSATQRSSGSTQSADTEWILAVGGGSARTARSEMELEMIVPSTVRSSSGAVDSGAPSPAPRRFMSAGRGRSRLPWEEERDERARAYEDMPNSAPTQFAVEETVPPKLHNRWVGELDNSQDLKKPQQRRTTIASLGLTEEQDGPGSYKQIYQQRQKRQPGPTARPNSFNGGVDGIDYTRDTKENGYSRPDQRTPRTFLDPISAEPVKQSEDSIKTVEEETPIALKASIARGSSTHRGNTKVPPISSSVDRLNDDDSDSAYSISSTGTPTKSGSLRGIRNSASKKKAERLFDRIEKQNSRQSIASPTESDPVSESGFFSTSTSTSNRSRKSENVEKIKATGHGALPFKRPAESLDINDNKNTTVHLDFNPNSGVTFRENRNSDVQVVGRGYGDDSSSLYDTRSQQTNVRSRDRRRTSSKGSLLSSFGGSAPLLALSGLVPESDREEDRPIPPSRDKIALVGRGMFEAAQNPSEYPAPTVTTLEKNEKRRAEPAKVAMPAGVVGVAVRSSADTLNSDFDSAKEDDFEDDASSLTKSTSFKRSIILKQQQKKEEEEYRKREEEREKERKQQEKDAVIRQERERQKQKLKDLGSSESLSVEPLSVSGTNSTGSPSSSILKTMPPKLSPPAVTPRKTIKTTSEPVSSYPMPAVDRSPSEPEVPVAEWKPFSDPEASLRAAQKKLESDDWEQKTEGLDMIRRLSHFHPDVFGPQQLHPAILAVVHEVKNLRSQVSRLAITCLGEMFTSLKKNMDPDLDIVVRQLLAKAGESNNFIRDDVERALAGMVEGVTSQRALLALINGGTTHKNSVVRRTTAQFLTEVVEKMGSGKILSGIKDVTDRILPTVAQFVVDGSPETRYYGRKILWLLMSHPDFDRSLTKYLPANTLRNMQEVVESLKSKGLGDKPTEIASARSRRSGHGSRTGSSLRGGSANGGSENNITPPARRLQVTRTDDAAMEEMKTMVNQMSSNEWRQRHDAITSLQEMCIDNPNLIATHIVKIFDKFLPRLQDSNSKVNLHALRVMEHIVPILKDALHAVIPMATSNLAPNLSSKNREISSTAAEILNNMAVLLQPFASQAQSATGRSKAEIVEKVAYMADRVFERKPKQIVLHVLPLLWHLLGATGVGGGAGAGGGELRSATQQLASTLYSHMGQGLMDKANSEPSVTPRHLSVLSDLVS